MKNRNSIFVIIAYFVCEFAITALMAFVVTVIAVVGKRWGMPTVAYWGILMGGLGGIHLVLIWLEERVGKAVKKRWILKDWEAPTGGVST